MTRTSASAPPVSPHQTAGAVAAVPADRSGARDDGHLQALWLAGFASPHTRRAYARDVQAFLAWAGQPPLRSVTLADLQGWRNGFCPNGTRST